MPERRVKKEVDQFDDSAQSLRAHPSKAQILIEVNPEADRLGKILRMLKDT
jgi:hypothetical protein